MLADEVPPMLLPKLPCRVVLLFLLCVAAPISAADWPGWRGPHGDGTSPESGVPTEWHCGKNGEDAKNIAWRVPLDVDGHASPVVWGDFVLLVGADVDSKERVLLALDRRTGNERWRRTVVEAPLESKHELNSYASGTPATDGELIFVSFLEVDGRTVPAPNVGAPRDITPGEMVVAAYDFEGNHRWVGRPGTFLSAHGFASSPVLFEDLVIVNGDHDGPAYIAALDKKTGETIWKVERENGVRSYVTPLIRKIGGRWQMMLSGSESVASYDPHTGERLWVIDGPTEQFVASPVMNAGLLFVTGGFPDKHILAIDPQGEGNVTGSHVRWRHERTGVSYVPSPVPVSDYFVLAADNGIATCYDARTGERLWMERLGRRHSASAVAADGNAYFLDDDGITWVVKPGPEFELVAKNELNEPVSASPAISRGNIFIRTEDHLLCIGPQPATR
jgi:outer membrane protein assembly factor BamB